jgi:2',3'-cyclic-nucleotide 2'-phosphodiesterase/3'-nucleotidase
MVLKRLAVLLILSLLPILVIAQRDVTLKIIQTSDVHGAILPFDFINNQAVDFGLAHVITYVNQERNKENQEVILLDNGDMLQGQPTVYFANYMDSLNHHVIPRIMNYMGYDAATVGNHDIEAGPKIYNQLVNEFEFPWLSANILDKKTGLPYFKPYTIINRQGVRIAVMGLTTPGVIKWLSPTLWPQMEFVDMVDAAKTWMDSIRINENPHIVIGLFHSGHDASFEGANPNEPLNENASSLVGKQVPGFDVLLIGHDHDRVVKKIVNCQNDSVLIVDPSSQARVISEVVIKVNLNENDEIVKKTVSGELIPMQGLMPDPEYVSYFSDFSRHVEEFVDRRIGSITTTVSSRDAYFGPSEFVNLIHTVQLGVSNTDISFAAPLSFDVSIEQGPVYVRDMFKLYIYENLLYIMNLSGKEIKDYLEYSYSLWLNTMSSADDNLLLFRKGDDGKLITHNNGRALLKSSYFNFDCAAGIRYQVDASKPVGQRVNILSMEDGSPFSQEKIYQVAINSYRGTGGGEHLTQGVGLTQQEIRKRIVSTSSKDMRYFLMKWIEHSGKYNPVNPNNWEIIPTEWVQKAAKKDRFLLFGEE